ncbi:MAG: hypothetical protein AAFW70_12015 [Cyanobacteria bacterium J06635_10]
MSNYIVEEDIKALVAEHLLAIASRFANKHNLKEAFIDLDRCSPAVAFCFLNNEQAFILGYESDLKCYAVTFQDFLFDFEFTFKLVSELGLTITLEAVETGFELAVKKGFLPRS